MEFFNLLIQQEVIKNKMASAEGIIENSSVDALNELYQRFNLSPLRDRECLEDLQYINEQNQIQYLN